MRALPMVTVSLAVGFVVGCYVPPVAPRAVSSSPLGGPCTATGDCASGLSCRSFLAEGYPPGFHVNGEVSSLCTQSCADAGCPSGSTCLDAQGDADGGELFCVKTCASAGDCVIGGRAQACATVSDAGPRVCQYLSCGRSGDTACVEPNLPCTGQCPSGFSCVGRTGEYDFCQSQ